MIQVSKKKKKRFEEIWMRSTAKRINLNLSACVFWDRLLLSILGYSWTKNNSPASDSCVGLGAFTVMPGSETNLSSERVLCLTRLLTSDTAWDPWNTMKDIWRQQWSTLLARKWHPGRLHREYKTRNGNYLSCFINNNTETHS